MEPLGVDILITKDGRERKKGALPKYLRAHHEPRDHG